MNLINAWSDDLGVACKILAEQGKSAYQISIEIQKSRCAVIGWCRRNKINLSRIRRKKKDDQPAPAIRQVIKTSPRVIFEPLKVKAFEHCQFIFGEPRYRHFCDKPISTGSYCKNHHKICYAVTE